MRNEKIEEIFNRQAATYDRQWSRLAPLRDALHLLAGAVFAERPPTARALCVGAGTGAEIAYLAERFPEWRFAVVEPALSMLETCRGKMEALGIADRCVFYHGYIESMPAAELFDAATSFLVSQFILDREARVRFFRAISERLRPGGVLVSTDLAADVNSPRFSDRLEVWFRTMSAADLTPEALEKMREAYRTDVAVLPPAAVEEILVAGGFAEPVLFYQCGLIHGWYARRGRNSD